MKGDKEESLKTRLQLISPKILDIKLQNVYECCSVLSMTRKKNTDPFQFLFTKIIFINCFYKGSL